MGRNGSQEFSHTRACGTRSDPAKVPDPRRQWTDGSQLMTPNGPLGNHHPPPSGCEPSLGSPLSTVNAALPPTSVPPNAGVPLLNHPQPVSAEGSRFFARSSTEHSANKPQYATMVHIQYRGEANGNPLNQMTPPSALHTGNQ